jgi:hypothetical protein
VKALVRLRALSAVVVLLLIAQAPPAAQPAAVQAGITGLVLAPDGAPVTQGNVALMSSSVARVTAAIDRTGHFRIVPDEPGLQRLFISVPGYAPYRANVTVPASRVMALPDLTLLEPTYFHARFVTADGESLPAGGMRRRSIDSDGGSIPDPLGHVREQLELDGSITIGPLPPGRTLLAFDRPAFAQTRLRDVSVTGTKQTIDGGTTTIDRGAQLQVDILDGAGQPVPRHDVWIEDAVQPSPLSFMPVKTNAEGRAVFERLASGRYRVWTKTAERCGNQELTLTRLQSTSGSGVTRMRLVIGGRAAFRITSPLGPVTGRNVYASPDTPPQAPWQFRYADAFPRPRQLPIVPSSVSSCSGATDADGRVVLTPFPPGQARLRVILFNSSFTARLSVPASGREMVVEVPDGLMPVKVTDQTSREPVQAQVVWVGGGGRVEASTNANGDALLEATGATGGTLTISARGYQTLEGSFDETPGTLQEVALMPLPSELVTLRVVNSDGEALAGAVVELLTRSLSDPAEFVAANAKGIATFTGVPPGQLQFSAHADGYTPATVRVAEDARASILITLTRPK